jgi:hypothetical protein
MRNESWASRLARVESQLLLRRPDLKRSDAREEPLCQAA